MNSTARMSDVAGSITRCTLRHWRRPCGPCLRAYHSPTPRNLIPVLSTRGLSGPATRRYGICTARVFCLRHRVEKSGTGQFNPASLSRLATIPAVCRKGSLNNTLIDIQNWMAALEKTGGRPGRPSCGASQAISLSNQTSSEPRLPSAAL